MKEKMIELLDSEEIYRQLADGDCRGDNGNAGQTIADKLNEVIVAINGINKNLIEINARFNGE